MTSATSSSDRITLYGVRQIGQRESKNVAEKYKRLQHYQCTE